MLELRAVQAHEVSRIWDLVRAGVEECLPHDPDQPRAEDVYSMLRTGNATLLIGWLNGQYAGHVILTTHTSPWSGLRYAHVWQAYNTTGHDVLRQGQQQLERMAKEAGCLQIRFKADRLAYERLVRDLGYTLCEVHLVKDI